MIIIPMAAQTSPRTREYPSSCRVDTPLWRACEGSVRKGGRRAPEVADQVGAVGVAQHATQLSALPRQQHVLRSTAAECGAAAQWCRHGCSPGHAPEP